jgi:pilus assembly protein Flp/PilA
LRVIVHGKSRKNSDMSVMGGEILMRMREKVITFLKKIRSEVEGASAIEYALLASLIGAATLGAQSALGTSLLAMYQGAVNTITSAMN